MSLLSEAPDVASHVQDWLLGAQTDAIFLEGNLTKTFHICLDTGKPEQTVISP